MFIQKFILLLFLFATVQAEYSEVLTDEEVKLLYLKGAETKLPDSLSDPKQLFDISMKTTYETVKNIDPSLWGVVGQWKEYFDSQEKENEHKKPTFFFFFTVGEAGSINSGGLPYFTASASKLKKKHSEINFYGVLRGFPKDKTRTIELFSSEAKAGNGTKAGMKIKFLPTLFEELHVDRAPAYAFAYCKKTFGTRGGCDFKYIVRGGVGLEGLLDLMADHNSSYKGLAADVRAPE